MKYEEYMTTMIIYYYCDSNSLSSSSSYIIPLSKEVNKIVECPFKIYTCTRMIIELCVASSSSTESTYDMDR